MRAMNIGKAAALALTVVWAAGCSTTNTSDSGSMGADSAATTQGASGSTMSGTSMSDVKNRLTFSTLTLISLS